MIGILRPFTPISWFHPGGIFRVLKRLEPMLPNVGGSLFLTFTLDPSRFADMADGFERGRDRLRRVFFKLRRGVEWNGKLWKVDAPYCIKVEFHVSGAAHFHAIFLTRSYVPNDLIAHLWGLGFTKVSRISAVKFRYLLKYVVKGGSLPDWVLTRSRLRVFQSSHGFMVKTEEPKEPEADGIKLQKRRLRSNIGERLERWRRTAVLEREEERYRVILRAPWKELFDELVYPIAVAGRYLGFGKIQIDDIGELDVWISPLPSHKPAAAIACP
jgi:hypothetical protein